MQLLVAADMLERFLWVAYGPDVAQVVRAMETSPAISASFFEPPSLLVPIKPGRPAKEDDEEVDNRGLSLLVSRLFGFVDRISEEPDIVFRAVLRNLHGFAMQNLAAEQGWFANSDMTEARLSAAGRIAFRWTVEDEDAGDVGVRCLARSLELNCESVFGALRSLDVTWRRIAYTPQAVWAEGAVGARDVRFFAAADGTAELAVRGGSVPDALATVDEFTSALDQVAAPVESIDSLLSGILQRMRG